MQAGGGGGSLKSIDLICITVHGKNDQLVVILMKTGLNNILQPTFFTVVNNIEQYLFTVGPNTSMLAVKFFSPVFVIFDHFHSPKR